MNKRLINKLIEAHLLTNREIRELELLEAVEEGAEKVILSRLERKIEVTKRYNEILKKVNERLKAKREGRA